MNWEEACRVLGVSSTATDVEINAQYLYRAQLLHPDKTSSLPEKVRKKAEEELKLVNVAHGFLKVTTNRPKNPSQGSISQDSPPKLSVSPKDIRFGNMSSGQRKSTVIEIESIGGTYTKFWMDDSPAPWLKVVQVTSTTSNPLPLEVTIEATCPGSLQTHNTCSLPIRIENEKAKTKDEIILRIELEAKATSSKPWFDPFGWFTRESPQPTKTPHNPQSHPRPHSTQQRTGQKVFVVSDTHFDHTNIIRYCNRPFRHFNKTPDVEMMNRTIINNWNSVVGRNDIVYFLGDLAFGRGARGPGYWLSRLNGHIIKIRGSHDRDIRGTKNVEFINHNGIPFLLIHDPNEVKNWNGWVIHGHKHTDENGNCPSRYPFINGYNKTINANLELTNYKPVNLDEICSLGLDRIKRMTTISSTPEKW